MNSRFDAASNLDAVEATVDAMPGSVLLTLEGPGHPASFMDNSCIAAAESAYLISLSTPDVGATCAAELQPFG